MNVDTHYLRVVGNAGRGYFAHRNTRPAEAQDHMAVLAPSWDEYDAFVRLNPDSIDPVASFVASQVNELIYRTLRRLSIGDKTVKSRVAIPAAGKKGGRFGKFLSDGRAIERKRLTELLAGFELYITDGTENDQVTELQYLHVKVRMHADIRKMVRDEVKATLGLKMIPTPLDPHMDMIVLV